MWAARVAATPGAATPGAAAPMAAEEVAKLVAAVADWRRNV